jgi:fatty acid desaturase
MEKNKNHKTVAEWKELVAEYQHPHFGRAIWQIVNTLGSVAAIWVALYFTMGISWWLTLGLSALAGLFLVRSFIIFHDCGHGSFFKSKKQTTFWVSSLECLSLPLTTIGDGNMRCTMLPMVI